MNFAMKQKLIFDKIYRELTTVDKRNFKEAMSCDPEIMSNINNFDKRHKQFICLEQFEEKRILTLKQFWSDKRNKEILFKHQRTF